MIPVLTSVDIQKKLSAINYPAQNTYLAMYSSWWGGIVKDPSLMLLPLDDHIVHRGDGVFEAIKVVQRKIYLLEEHLQRLAQSAQKISLTLPYSLDQIRDIILQTSMAAQVDEAVLRLYISRGPGHFSTNPYDSVGSQMYLVVTSLTRPAATKYTEGVCIGRSQIPPKEPWLATIKTCNYLPNVMMKKESVDRKLDFTVSFDDKGFLTEGSTENIVIVTSENELMRPKLSQILKGTTMMRTFELAQDLISSGLIKSIGEKDINEEDLLQAQEVFMIGTTLDVLPVREYENQKIGGGQVGPVARELLKRLEQDMITGPKAKTLDAGLELF